MLTFPRNPAIVAVIATIRDFDEISKLSSAHFDLCELRIDLLCRLSADLEGFVGKLPSPKILTVRDPNEGGANAISETTRLELFERWLPLCDLVDVELLNLSRFSGLVQQAESTGKGVIVSFHDFTQTPSLEKLQEMLDGCHTGKR